MVTPSLEQVGEKADLEHWHEDWHEARAEAGLTPEAGARPEISRGGHAMKDMMMKKAVPPALRITFHPATTRDRNLNSRSIQ